MVWQTTPYVYVYVFAALVSIVAGFFAWRKRDEPGGKALTVFLFGLGFAMLTHAYETGVTDVDEALIAVRVGFFGNFIVSSAWVYFAIEYTGRHRWANRRTIGLLALEPALMTLIFLVPGTEDLLWTQPEMVNGQLELEPGIAMGLHFVYYFLALVVGSLMFLQLFIRSRHLYRTQAGAVLVAALIPWAGNALRLSGVSGELEAIPLSLVVSGCALTLALYRFRFLDPVPVAHDSIVEMMGDGVVVLDLDDRVGEINPAACSLLGVSKEGAVGTHIKEIFDGWDLVNSTDDAEDTTEKRWEEVSFTIEDEEHHVEVEVNPFSDHHDRRVGRFVVLRDITERKRREQNLARYKTIYESVKDRVYVLDPEKRFIMVNDPFTDLVGYSEEELVGEPVSKVFVDSDGWEEAVNGEIELSVKTEDGLEIPCEIVVSSVDFGHGEFETVSDNAGFVGVIRDISDRKQAERDLKETQGRLNTFVEAAPLAIIATDKEGTVEVWNPAAESVFGWSQNEVLGDFIPVLPDSESEKYSELSDRVFGGERVTGFEMKLECKDGSMIDASISAAPLHDASGQIEGFVGVIADITERKERERELERKNQRLEKFASIISHDLRGPLGVANGYIEMAKDDLENYEKILSAHERIENIIERVLELARKGETVDKTVTINVAEVARDAWHNVETRDATLEIGDPPEVEGDPERLLSVFENLFRNAIEHGSPTSPESESDDSAEQDEYGVKVELGRTETGFYVEDDGPGIPEDDRDKIFEEGYTTDDEGTGYGLSIVKEIIDAHGWEINVGESEEGGARLEVITQLDTVNQNTSAERDEAENE